MNKLLAILGLLFMGLPANANSRCKQIGLDAYIHKAESRWAESVASGDTSVAKRILADDFVGVSTSGLVYDKRGAVADNGAKEFASDHLDYVRIHLHRDTAVVQGSERWVRKDGTSGHFVWIDTWMCLSGGWKIVSATDVNVADKPK